MIKLTNKQYNFIKWFITIFLPAIGALYFALAQTFDFSRIPGVNGTINAIIAFLGIVTGISTAQYNKTANQPDGDLVVQTDPTDGTPYLGLALNTSVQDAVAKDQVKLNVVAPPESK